MADEIKRIFKNEIIGEPQIQKVLRNKVQGVNGILTSNILSEEKELWQTTEVISDFTITTTENSYSQSGSVAYFGTGFERKDTYENAAITINATFQRPTHISEIRFKVEWARSGFGFSRSSLSGITQAQVLSEAQSIIRAAPVDRRNMASPSSIWTDMQGNRHESTITESTDTIQKPSNPDPFNFYFSGKYSLNKISNIDFYNTAIAGAVTGAHIRATSGTSTDRGFSYYPLNVTVTLWGTELISSDVAFQVGEQTNAFPFPKNPLLATKATKDGQPLYEFLANEIIIDEWRDGKQITNLTKIINDNPDLEQKSDNIKIMNTRETTFIDDSQSFSRHPDGTARIFTIDSAEVVYDGSLRQNLNISEKTK